MLQGAKKWIPLIKKNREADKIDFTRRKKVQQQRPTMSVMTNNPIA
jgi:hypothetical protein